MSNIGKQPIDLPEGTEINVKEGDIVSGGSSTIGYLT